MFLQAWIIIHGSIHRLLSSSWLPQIPWLKKVQSSFFFNKHFECIGHSEASYDSLEVQVAQYLPRYMTKARICQKICCHFSSDFDLNGTKTTKQVWLAVWNYGEFEMWRDAATTRVDEISRAQRITMFNRNLSNSKNNHQGILYLQKSSELDRIFKNAYIHNDNWEVP